MRFAKLLGGAGLLVATALVGGTLIGSVLAAPAGGSKDSITTDAHGPFDGDGEYCDVFLDTFASELGVSRDDLIPASKAAAVAAIDAAVEAGDMDADRAATLKERIEELDEAGCGMGFGLGFGRGMAVGEARGIFHADVLDAAAEELGLERSVLVDRLADDITLEEVAEAEGVAYDDVKSAVLEAVQADLDAAVAEGLDQDRADAMLLRIQTWLDEGGEAGLGRFGVGGPGQRGGPWH
jgi:hypothetical protein